MNIIIKTKNIELTDSLEALINKRLIKLNKFIISLVQKEEHFGKIMPEFLVEIKKETRHHRKGDLFWADVIIRLPGKKLVAQACQDDMLLAITKARDEMQREIRKYKTKIIDMPRRKAKKAKR